MATTEILCKSPMKTRKFADLEIGALFFAADDLSTPFRKNSDDITSQNYNANQLGEDEGSDFEPEEQVVLIVRATFEA